MNSERKDLIETFRQLDSEELLNRYQSKQLSDVAQAIVSEELQRRGIPIPMLTDANDDGGGEGNSSRDLFVVATYYIPTDAFIVQGCLVAARIPAVLADENLVQTNSLLTAALGGVRILVPASYMQEARDVIEAFNRGEYQLGDDADVGTPIG